MLAGRKFVIIGTWRYFGNEPGKAGNGMGGKKDFFCAICNVNS